MKDGIMAELKRITREELIINLLALYYHCTVAEVLRVVEEEKKQKELTQKEKVTYCPPR